MNNYRIIFCVLLAVLAFQSCKSPEDKVKDIVKDQIKSSLYNAKSFKSVDIVVDSIFSVDGSSHAIISLFEIEDLLEENNDIIQEVKNRYSYRSQNSAAIMKQYGRIKKKIESKINQYIDDYYSTETKKFAGYIASVDFTANNLSGNETPGAGIFIIDQSIENIEYAKIYDALEIIKKYLTDKKYKFEMIQDYIDDIHESGDEFNIDEFIEYMML